MLVPIADTHAQWILRLRGFRLLAGGNQELMAIHLQIRALENALKWGVAMIRKHKIHQEMKAEEVRYWQSVSAQVRMEAVSELTDAAYSLKGTRVDVPRLQGPFVRVPRPRR
jgi:hypothetical protein